MDRICGILKDRVMSADEAASMIQSGMTLGFSGFTLSGYPKLVPLALVSSMHAKDLTVLTSASTGDELDGAMSRAGLMAKRYPYQSNKDLRTNINNGTTLYSDMHLSHLPAYLQRGTMRIDYAIIECLAVTEDGIVPTLSVGASNSIVNAADKVILELNEAVPLSLMGIHDIFNVSPAPNSAAIPVMAPLDRVGTQYIPCPPEKIAAIVISNTLDQCATMKPVDDVSQAISERIVGFLKSEVAAGRQPKNLLPLQSGVGSIANAVLKGLADSDFENMTMYTETFQQSALELVEMGKFVGASTTAISLSDEGMARLLADPEWYKQRMVVRPQDVTNHPEVIRRLGIVAMNTPIEFDIYGNVNSTHIMGTSMMNGIGGSGDFARNAGLTIFATPSVAKGGAISAIVPMCSHIDHTEHDTQIFVTEHGLADLRWKTPVERAELIIENCAHPDYKPLLREYFNDALRLSKAKHTPHVLSRALSWHTRYMETGSMK